MPGTEAPANARLLGTILLLGLFSVVLLLGLEMSADSARARDSARCLVAEALAEGKSIEHRMELFRRARTADPTYDAAACERGLHLERRGRFEDAAASFQTCLEGDPNLAYAQVRYARSLLRARGSASYLQARAALRHFLETASEDPGASRETAGLRAAEELVADLEELLEEQSPHSRPEHLSADDLRRILLRDLSRGPSRYEGPRVPLRLGFRPGDATLGTLAEEQLREVGRALRDGSLLGSSIQIEGHTDSVEGGTRKHRVEIAFRRAEAAREFLVRRCGIPANRLRLAGFADDYPLAPNDSEEGRAANRRVELVNLTTRDVVWGDVRDRL